ncbi:lytic transglycosylase domain-containing protein [Acidithiobacillus sp.]|jgi:hypothetical protein|uniref:lytic transglycosylase domain-containing protein n=1 Tax=Acidithiobacillus sp. TaxID=1872118 RepID=UPI002606ABF2|nr:transglycosylase SLT domain-containing protein [Acidithiobacillus sp.]MDD5280161.1 transglycosylase SLT domain-containing protein [Acidithiobacillus sp.]
MMTPPCLEAAAQHWQVHRAALVRQYDAQAGRAHAGVGVMGIPTVWLPILEKNGFSVRRLKTDACINIAAAALILAVEQMQENRAKVTTQPAPACLRQAAQTYAVSWPVVQRYYNAQQNVSVNARCYGPMHIPAGWLPLLRYAGFPEWRVKHDACWNMAAGVWILAAEHAGDRVTGTGWKGTPINGIPTIPARIIQDATYASAQTGVPKALLMAVAWQESGFNPQAVSPAGAQGLMQFIPSTWARYGQGSPFNPRNAMLAGARYLRHLALEFHSWPLALAGYNAGGQAVVEAGDHIPDFTQTQHYVPAVLGRYRVLASQSGTP